MDSDVDRQKTFHFFCEREQDIRINVTMIFNAKIIIYQPNYFDVKKRLNNALLIFLALVTISRLLIRGFAFQTRKKAENSRQALITKLQFASTTVLNECNT